MKKINFLFALVLLAISFNAAGQTAFKVEKTGGGQAVLLLPGFACTHEVFDDLTVELSKNYEVHAFTFAGFGGVAPISFPWLPQIKTELENYVKEHHLDKPIIIGHSLGGTLGLWLASSSSVYSRLIVIDALPAMGALMIPDYKSESIAYDSPQNSQMLEMDTAAFRQMAIQSATYMTGNADARKLLVAWTVTADRKTYVYGYTDLLNLDLREALPGIHIPVCILAATSPYGKEAAEVNYRKQYEKLPDYSLKFAEGSRHFIMYDQPEWLMDEIQSNLKIK